MRSKYDIDEINRKTDVEFVPQVSLNDIQFGGSHYKQFNDYQPWDVVRAWNLGYLDGTALKYIARWRHKGGLEDIRKAIHFLQKLVEVEEEEAKQNGQT